MDQLTPYNDWLAQHESGLIGEDKFIPELNITISAENWEFIQNCYLVSDQGYGFELDEQGDLLVYGYGQSHSSNSSDWD